MNEKQKGEQRQLLNVVCEAFAQVCVSHTAFLRLAQTVLHVVSKTADYIDRTKLLYLVVLYYTHYFT